MAKIWAVDYNDERNYADLGKTDAFAAEATKTNTHNIPLWTIEVDGNNERIVGTGATKRWFAPIAK